MLFELISMKNNLIKSIAIFTILELHVFAYDWYVKTGE